MAGREKQVIRRRALKLIQNDAHPLYVFALTGEELQTIAEISRLSRNDVGKLIGYQRPEVRRHVQDIVAYLNGENILFPNSIILALSSQVRFVRSRGPEIDDGLAAAGILEVPVPRNGRPKPAWIVDGQQRALALTKSRRSGFPIPINAFVADEVELQRDQFLRVNNTMPLPRGLITELLPEVTTALPSRLAARRLPSAICEWLNQSPASPFRGLIRRASDEAKDKGVVADTSVVKMIEESLTSTSGCLFPYRNIATGETDAEGICAVLVVFWTAVKRVFPGEWGKPASRGRLMHGAGIRSMGRLMDRVMAGVNPRDARATDLVERELHRVAPICRWSDGHWQDLNEIPWNDIQNVPRHIRMLSNLLIRTYVQSKGTVG
jgi:DGQHR domain-containing protein